MINRISFNHCRYLIGTFCELLEYCFEHKINYKWIRIKRQRLYLRLWNSYKNK